MSDSLAQNILVFIAGFGLGYLFVRFVEWWGRQEADARNVSPVPEDDAYPLRQLFEEPDARITPPEVAPAKRGRGRPRKTATVAGGQVIDGPYPAYTEEEQVLVEEQVRAARPRRERKSNRTH